MHKKLFIPGPTEVRAEILQTMATPMIGHRSSEFSELYERLVQKLKKVLYTENHVFISTSSATGLMEAAVRNTVAKKCLNLVCGAFSERWHTITVNNGLPADKLEVEWGKGITPEMIEERLSTGQYDAVTLVHNETSTGVMNPLEKIADIMKKYPDVMFLTDTVSSMMGYKIEVDKLGIDVCLASVQKCFALPPGLAICSVSPKALEKAKTIPYRGYYFDFLEFLKYDQKKQTPSTPAIPHMYALDKQLDDIMKEGLENRFHRHKQMAEITREWAKTYFAMFPEAGFESVTLTCVKNTRNINVAEMNKELAKKGVTISNGYGKLKEQTFRIGHMGDHTVEDIKQLLAWINEIVGLKVLA